ncbi:MAG: phosphate ABC transporter substrate-binding protein [Lentisphaerae bacterium]|nr:phosphate ABC transporter substrate-binding protein [Lentisphaerota bacterium]
MAAVAVLVAGCGGGGGTASGPGARTTIANIGSDTMLNLAAAWAEAYDRVDPSVSVEVSGGGSGQGAAALINGSCDVANCSRKLEEREAGEIRSRRSREPKEHIVGYDALSIFVHRSNPLEEISVEDLGEMYRDGGTITRWSQIGVTIPGAKGDAIILVNRQNSSGTYHYFKEAVVGKKNEFRLSALHMNGSKDAVELIANTPNSIGYSGMGYATPEVRQVRVSRKRGERGIAPCAVSALDGSYPIARPMFMYTAGEPEGALRAYLEWILSPKGQEIVESTGYVPRPAR